MNDLIVYFGASNDASGGLSVDAKDRLNLVLELHKKYEDSSVLLTGGKGEHFNTTNKDHWRYAKEYLMVNGLSDFFMLPGMNTENTVDDIRKISTFLHVNSFSRLLLVTSDYHIPRVSYLASREFNMPFLVFPAAGAGLMEKIDMHDELSKVDLLTQGSRLL